MADKTEALKLQKDILVSAFFGLAKAAQEASNAAIDFVKVLDVDGDPLTTDIQQLADIINGTKNALLGSTGAKKRKGDDADADLADGEPKKRKKRVVIRDPNAPKKPLTAYFAFAAQARKAISDERLVQGLPTLSSNEMTGIVAQQWKELTDDAKEKYKGVYKKEWESYLKVKSDYDQTKDNNVTTSEVTVPVNAPSAASQLPVEISLSSETKSDLVETPKKKKKDESKTPDSKKEKKKNKKKHRISELKDKE